MITVILSRHGTSAGVRLAGTTREEFAGLLDSFKGSLPATARRYDPDLRLWLVSASHYSSLLLWCRQAERDFGATVVNHYGEPERERHGKLTVEDACEVLCLTAGALKFPTVVRAAYRALANELHPDKGGDEEAMKRVNAAYEVLNRGLAA